MSFFDGLWTVICLVKKASLAFFYSFHYPIVRQAVMLHITILNLDNETV